MLRIEKSGVLLIRQRNYLCRCGRIQRRKRRFSRYAQATNIEKLNRVLITGTTRADPVTATQRLNVAALNLQTGE